MADSSAVRIMYSGKAYVAPVGSTVPTTPFAAWDAAFNDLGLCSEDGLAEAPDQDRSDFYAWGYPNAPVRSQIKKDLSTFELTFLETNNPHVLSLYHGVPTGSMTSTASSGGNPQWVKWTKAQASAPDIRALGIDLVDGTYLQRIIIPRCEVVERGPVTYKADGLAMYRMVFRPLVASDGTTHQRMVTNVTLPS